MSLLSTRQIQLIATIAETGQLQIAASDLHMPQPAASRMLADIEKKIGIELFERTPKGMLLTLAGERIIKQAKFLNSEINDFNREVQNLRTGLGGRIRIGAVTGPALGFVLPAVQALKRSVPDLDVFVDVSPSPRLLRQLLEGQIDFALARYLPAFDRSDFIIQEGQVENLKIITRHDHPLTNQPPLHASDLLHFEWVLQDHNSPIRETMIEYFMRNCGQIPNDIIATSSLLFTLGYIANSDALTVLTQETVEMLTQSSLQTKVHIVETTQPVTVPSYKFIWRRHHHVSSLASRLARDIQKQIKRPMNMT